MMTTKDYEAIATVARNMWPVNDYNLNDDGTVQYAALGRGTAYAFDHWEDWVRSLAMSFSPNPRFDADRFYHACRYYAEDRIKSHASV